jgi:hypothetical protein
MTLELQELTKCFEKSELIRQQQKILISKMKAQIETLQETNADQVQQIARLVASDRISQFNRANQSKPEGQS